MTGSSSERPTRFRSDDPRFKEVQRLFGHAHRLEKRIGHGKAQARRVLAQAKSALTSLMDSVTQEKGKRL